MRPLLIVAALLASAPALAVPPTHADREALELLKDAADVAWNDKDHARMAALYAEGASLRVAPTEAEVTGRAAIQRFFAAAFARRPGEFRHVTLLDGADMVGDASAVTEGYVRVEQKNTNGEWVLVRRFRTLSLAERTPAGWRLRWVRAVPLS